MMRSDADQVVKDTTQALKCLDDAAANTDSKDALQIGPIPPAISPLFKDWKLKCLIRRANAFTKQEQYEAGKPNSLQL